ncbi:MAG: flagellar basal-body rod protein FlgF [Gammaproteobacteria bacterium]|nr:MAG: flagellar basal-body rod protein FlgF [Gammaproteobacteria bacterium]
MERMIYLAMNGAREVMLRQANNSHNLANLDTTGFKADLDNFRSLPVYGPGHPTRVYVEDERAGVDLSAGQIMTTGRDLDVAIDGDGFMAVQNIDGSEGYTRAGDLRVTAEGLLQTGAGHPVMGDDGPIALPPFSKLEIGSDGSLSILPAGQTGGPLAVIDRIRLVRLDERDVVKADNGVLTLADGAETPAPDASVSLVSGALESSNVNPIEAMVTMIELSRQFEMQVKMMKAAEDNDAAADKLLQLPS